MEYWIKTVTGRHFDLMQPEPEQVDIEDIAWGLSNLCRFAGQTPRFYSVAQHSVLVSDYLHPLFRLHGLLHDAAEAYLGDVMGPAKALLPDYQRLEALVMQAISERFNLFWSSEANEHVVEADRAVLGAEIKLLFNDDPEVWDVKRQSTNISNISPSDPTSAYKLFMHKFEVLRG